MFRTKLIRPEVKVLDEDAGTVSAIMSTEAKDRDGDVIRAGGWKLDTFLRHPVLLANHSYGSLSNQIGEWQDVKIQGKRLVGTAKYYIGEGNEQADWGFKLAQKGRAAYSVGFIPDMDKAKPLKDGDSVGMFTPMEFNGQELIECSQVTVPSNPQALQRMKLFDLDPEIQRIVDEELGDSEAQIDLDSLAQKIADLIDLDVLAEKVAAGIDIKETVAAAVKGHQQETDGGYVLPFFGGNRNGD